MKSAVDNGESEHVCKTLRELFLAQINLLVMSRHAKGHILEKTRHFERAIREYRAGKKMVEIHLGQGHQFFAMLSSAMGGARLKAKTMGENSEIKNHIRKKVT